MTVQPRYPVYIVSKGRWGPEGTTARRLIRDDCHFRVVVEPQEADDYAKAFGPQNVLVLPFSDLGQGSIPARNWIWDHAANAGYERHWILDDNIHAFYYRYRAQRVPCTAQTALLFAEHFIDRYENVAIGGLNYVMFCPEKASFPAFTRNVHVYSCLCIRNDLPFRWRGRYNEDADLCLQVLAGGWCTVLLNAFLAQKRATMTMKGGNSDELYKGDGRAHMARSLERMWPGVVETRRKWGRPQHHIRYSWAKFDTPLIAKDPPPDRALPTLRLLKRKDVRSPDVAALVARWDADKALS